ncbi:ABC transporter permease [soil metagenome]
MNPTLLADAVASEAYRFARNRMAVFWSILFVPIMGLLLSIAGEMLKQKMQVRVQSKLVLPMVHGVVDLGQGLVKLAADVANPLLLLFILIGAATIYAGDYRWETWRLITARNTRANLILGKVGVAKLMVLMAIVMLMVFGFIGTLVNGAVAGQGYAFHFGGTEAVQFGLLLLVGFVRIVQVTLIGLLAAVVTRSLLATLFVPLVVTIAQFFLMQASPLFGWKAGDWVAQLLIPGLASDSLKALILHEAAGAPADLGVKAAISLALWCFVVLAASIALFQRQDLSKE